METLANVLIWIAIVCSILLVLVLISVLAYYQHAKSSANKLLQGAERDANFVYLLLKTAFPSGRIIKQAALPLPDGQRAMTDLILYDRGGVFVIRIKTFPGMIDNSNRNVWTVSNGRGVGEFPNPFDQNRHSVNAIDTILKREKLFNVPKHNLVVFSRKKVAFKIRSEHLLTAERLIDTIRDINRSRFLDQNEINAVLGAIRKYCAPRNH